MNSKSCRNQFRFSRKFTLFGSEACFRVREPLTMAHGAVRPQTALSDSSLSPSSEDRRLASDLSDRVSQLLDKIDCRLADTREQREAIFCLRYRAYMREGAISQIVSGLFPTCTTKREMASYSGCTSTASWRAQSAFTWPPRNILTLPPWKSFPITCNLSSTPARSSSTRPASLQTRSFPGVIAHYRTPQCASPVWRANTLAPTNSLPPLGRSTKHFIGEYSITKWFAKRDLTQG